METTTENYHYQTNYKEYQNKFPQSPIEKMKYFHLCKICNHYNPNYKKNNKQSKTI
jgi:hypothetical protein